LYREIEAIAAKDTFEMQLTAELLRPDVTTATFEGS
jgi:ribonucleoside-diphosphate reductase beta chain